MREEEANSSTRDKTSSKTTSTTFPHKEWESELETLKQKMQKAGAEKQVKDLIAMKAKYDELVAAEPELDEDTETIITQILDSIK